VARQFVADTLTIVGIAFDKKDTNGIRIALPSMQVLTAPREFWDKAENGCPSVQSIVAMSAGPMG